MDKLDTDIEEVAVSIWSAMFGESLSLTPGGEMGTDHFVTSFIAISGAWTGAVIAQFPAPLAATLTAALYDSPSEPTLDDIRDALGEIGNILAGNIKALMPEPSGLSLPAVAFGSDYAVTVAGAATRATCAFTCDGQVFAVTVLESVVPDG